MLRTDVFTPSRFTSQGCIEVYGQKIPYHTVAEDTVFYDDDGKAIASMFTYSYFRSDVENTKDRPVIFCFNGGPGTSSMMVHVGYVGPTRLKYSTNPDDPPTPLPPYESQDNEYCLLDVADLVVCDPVGTGFGRLLDETKADKFWGIEPDAESFLTMIQKWLDRYNRWESPKYLMGESYGCTRAATIAGMGTLAGGTDRSFSMAFDGLIMIVNTVTMGKHFFDHPPVYAAVTRFPTLAAVHWYHNHPTEQSLEEFVYEASHWAATDYLVALFKGEGVVGEEREEIIAKLMHYTGVSRQYIEERNLVVEDVIYRSEVAKDKGLSVSRLDGRLTRPLYNGLAERQRGLGDDPAEGKYDPFFQSVLLGVICPKLNIKWDRNFLSSARLWAKWNNDVKDRNTAECVSDAMRRAQGMRVFFMNGWYDLCTETGILWYTMNHAGFPKDRVFFKGYESGHMIYLDETNVKMVNDDVRKFVMGKDPTK